MKAPFLRVVAGTALADQPSTPKQPAPRRREQGPHKEREPIEYKDGLPIIDPAGEADPIFSQIAKHREAAAHFDRCVNIVNNAENKVSDAE